MDTLPQGLASLPNELILLIFDNIKLITDKRQFLKTCKKYNKLTKKSFYNYEENYEIEKIDKIDKYCVEKFTLELCHDKYFAMIPERYIIPNNSVLIGALVFFDCLPLLIIAKEKGCDLDRVCEIACFNGKLEILKWTKEKGFAFSSLYAIYAIQNGHLEVLKWISANYNIIHIKEYLCDYAASHGQLDILKWAHENGYPWNAGTCSNATYNGNLECLKYARLNGCEWDKNVYLNAKKYKHLELLKWAIENGCPIEI